MVDVDALYRKYGPMVFRRCKRLLGSEERALDAMQECFVRVLKNQDRLNDAAPSSLLYCIATNVCLNVMRSERRERRIPWGTDDEEVLLSIASAEDVEALGLARRRIDELFEGELASTRTIAVLHYVDGLTLEETAKMAGLSVSGVRKRLASLKKRGLAKEGEAS